MSAAQWNWCSVENLDRLKIWNTSFIVPLTAAVWQQFIDIVPLWAPEWTESVNISQFLGTIHSSLDYCRVRVDSAKRRFFEIIVLKPISYGVVQSVSASVWRKFQLLYFLWVGGHEGELIDLSQYFFSFSLRYFSRFSPDRWLDGTFIDVSLINDRFMTLIWCFF